MSAEQATLEPHANHVSEAEPKKHEREIQEDVMDVPFVAWIGIITTIVVIISVILLTGIYYMTKSQEMATRQAEADSRITDMEAQRQIDAMVVEGFYRLPDEEDATGNLVRGGVSIPVAEGMRKIVEQYGK